MSFKAEFKRIPVSIAYKVSLPKWSLFIKCTNLLFGETVDVVLVPAVKAQPWIFKNVHFGAGQTIRIDKETFGWDWYQDDYALLVGPNNQVLEKFQFHIKEYAPGKCPECHGTKKCGKCNGTHFIKVKRNQYSYDLCDRCNYGVCPTCFIQYREYCEPQGPVDIVLL